MRPGPSTSGRRVKNIERDNAVLAYPGTRPIEWRKLATIQRWWRLVAFWAVAVAAAWSVATFSARNPTEYSSRASAPRTAVEALSAWDGVLYARIAAEGYSSSGDAARLMHFFPLFPGLSRLFGGAEAAPLAGILLSQLLALASLMLMSLMAHGEKPAKLSREPGFWLLVSPFGFFLLTFYTESLFLFLSLTHYAAYRSRALGGSAVAGLLAGLTRPTAVTLPAILGVEAIRLWRRKEQWRATAVAAATPAVGIAIYLAYVGWKTGHLFEYPRYMSSQASGPELLRIPLHPMAVDLRAWIHNYLSGGITPLFDMVLRNAQTCAVLLLLFLGRRRLPVSWLVYSGAALVLIHSFTPTLVSSGRYEIVLFPVFFALASTRLAKSRAWVVLALCFAIIWVVSLYRFTTWRWIG